MQSAGIDADSRKIQNEEYIEYRVRIPIDSNKDSELFVSKNEPWYKAFHVKRLKSARQGSACL